MPASEQLSDIVDSVRANADRLKRAGNNAESGTEGSQDKTMRRCHRFECRNWCCAMRLRQRWKAETCSSGPSLSRTTNTRVGPL